MTTALITAAVVAVAVAAGIVWLLTPRHARRPPARARLAWQEPLPPARRQLPARHAPGPALPSRAEVEAAVVLAEAKARGEAARAANPIEPWPGETTGTFAAVAAEGR